MAISKVVFGDDTVIDITDTTATASDVIEGKVVYMSNGVRTVGTADPHFGLPSGGAANEVLTKVSSSDYDIAWQSVPVQSVNGYTGAITLSANDVGALPSDTAIPSNAADVGAIAAPASASTDNVLAYNGSAWVPDKRMVILSYGSSTWAQFLSAYKSNAVIYCRASSNSNPATGSQTRMAFMAYVSNAENPTNVEFQYYRSVSTHTYAQQGDQVYVYKLTSDGTWSVTVREAYTKIVPGAGLSSSYSNSALTLTNVAAVPTGGTTGQALVKASSSNYALAWQTIDVGHSIPSGGLNGQVLAKSSNDDYEVAWATIHDIPAGGSNGQVLAKSSDSDYAVAWVDQSGDITTELASPSAVPPSSFILSVADGGTGGSTPSAARQNIGAVSAVEVAQASGSGFVLGINEGGTGANNADDALTNLGCGKFKAGDTYSLGDIYWGYVNNTTEINIFVDLPRPVDAGLTPALTNDAAISFCICQTSIISTTLKSIGFVSDNYKQIVIKLNASSVQPFYFVAAQITGSIIFITPP